MTPIIEAIKEVNIKLPDDPFLGKGTFAVTEISCEPGGGPIIPDKCAIVVDRRMIPSETLEGIMEDLKKIAKDGRVDLLVDEINCYTGYKTKVDQYFPGWIMDQSHWTVRKGVEAIETVLGERPDIIGWRFSTNGVATAGELGIPTIGFGPGDPSLAHQSNENINLKDVILSAECYSTLIEHIAMG
jgi:acetylornithine deacetylase/succinyl-diaminopimelate desuccinylase-like protein